MKKYEFTANMTKGTLKGMQIEQEITFENEKRFNKWIAGVNSNHKKGKCNFYVTKK